MLTVTEKSQRPRKEQITITVNRQNLARLKKIAEEKGRSVSEMVDRAIEEYVDDHEESDT